MRDGDAVLESGRKNLFAFQHGFEARWPAPKSATCGRRLRPGFRSPKRFVRPCRGTWTVSSDMRWRTGVSSSVCSAALPLLERGQFRVGIAAHFMLEPVADFRRDGIARRRPLFVPGSGPGWRVSRLRGGPGRCGWQALRSRSTRATCKFPCLRIIPGIESLMGAIAGRSPQSPFPVNEKQPENETATSGEPTAKELAGGKECQTALGTR